MRGKTTLEQHQALVVYLACWLVLVVMIVAVRGGA